MKMDTLCNSSAGSSKEHVQSMRLRFRQQAARFLQDVSEDVGSVLTQDASVQDSTTKLRLFELQQGINQQVQHMNKIIQQEKIVITSSNKKKKSDQKDIKFTQKELSTLRDIASQEHGEDGIVSSFLRRREETKARNRYHDFVKKAEKSFFEYRRDPKVSGQKFDLRSLIQKSVQGSTKSKRSRRRKSSSFSSSIDHSETVLRLTMGEASASGSAASTRRVSLGQTVSSNESNVNEVGATEPQLHLLGGDSKRQNMSRGTSRSFEDVFKELEGCDKDELVVRRVIDELCETIEEISEFEWQPFKTAVPPHPNLDMSLMGELPLQKHQQQQHKNQQKQPQEQPQPQQPEDQQQQQHQQLQQQKSQKGLLTQTIFTSFKKEEEKQASAACDIMDSDGKSVVENNAETFAKGGLSSLPTKETEDNADAEPRNVMSSEEVEVEGDAANLSSSACGENIIELEHSEETIVEIGEEKSEIGSEHVLDVFQDSERRLSDKEQEDNSEERVYHVQTERIGSSSSNSSSGGRSDRSRRDETVRSSLSDLSKLQHSSSVEVALSESASGKELELPPPKRVSSEKLEPVQTRARNAIESFFNSTSPNTRKERIAARTMMLQERERKAASRQQQQMEEVDTERRNRSRAKRDRQVRQKVDLHRSRSPWRHPDFYAHTRERKNAQSRQKAAKQRAEKDRAKASQGLADVDHASLLPKSKPIKGRAKLQNLSR